ncbi:MAG: hypothetical protein AAGA05_14000 [Pseudomonadota bacterium]
MQFVSTTPLAVLMFAGLLWLGPVRGLWILFLSMPMLSASAVNLPGLGSLTLTDACIMALWLSILGRGVGAARLFGTAIPSQPGFPLLLLLVFATIGAIFLPRLFAGQTEVFVLIRTLETGSILLSPLSPTGGNISQLVRLVMAGSVFFLLATMFRITGDHVQVYRAMVAATLLHIVLSVIDIGSYALGLPDLLDVLRTASVAMLDNQIVLGIKRLTAGFPEPSSFSYYTIGLYGFWLRYWFGARNSRLSGLMLLAVLALLVRSTSTSAYICLLIFTLLFLSWQFAEIARAQRATTLYVVLTTALPALAGIFVVLYNFVPAIPNLIDQILLSKLQSDSGVERMNWNLQALVNFAETYGLGAGIGSVRASSWMSSTLGSLGLIGAAVYVWFVAATLLQRPPVALRRSDAAHIVAALQSGCAAILIQSLITKPYPNLETPFFAMAGLAVGLCRYLTLKDRSRATRHAPDHSVVHGQPVTSG